MRQGVWGAPSAREKAFTTIEKSPHPTPHTSHPTPRKGVVLLMTLFFIIAVTVIVGVSLSQLRTAQKQLHEERFLVQSALTLEDILGIIGSAKQHFGDVNGTDSLDLFLTMAAALPLETEQVRGLLRVKSADGKININTLAASVPFQEALTAYLGAPPFQLQDPIYLVDLLIDCIGGDKEVYRTELPSEMPWIHRERIVDASHLEQIIDFYVRSRRDPAVYEVPWSELVRFGAPEETEFNANYATPQLWAMLLPDLLPEQFETLAGHTLLFYSKEDLNLPAGRAETLEEAFGLRYFTPRIELTLRLEDATGEQGHQTTITFEYDMKTKKARKFDYAI